MMVNKLETGLTQMHRCMDLLKEYHARHPGDADSVTSFRQERIFFSQSVLKRYSEILREIEANHTPKSNGEESPLFQHMRTKLQKKLISVFAFERVTHYVRHSSIRRYKRWLGTLALKVLKVSGKFVMKAIPRITLEWAMFWGFEELKELAFGWEAEKERKLQETRMTAIENAKKLGDINADVGALKEALKAGDGDILDLKNQMFSLFEQVEKIGSVRFLDDNIELLENAATDFKTSVAHLKKLDRSMAEESCNLIPEIFGRSKDFFREVENYAKARDLASPLTSEDDYKFATCRPILTSEPLKYVVEVPLLDAGDRPFQMFSLLRASQRLNLTHYVRLDMGDIPDNIAIRKDKSGWREDFFVAFGFSNRDAEKLQKIRGEDTFFFSKTNSRQLILRPGHNLEYLQEDHGVACAGYLLLDMAEEAKKFCKLGYFRLEKVSFEMKKEEEWTEICLEETPHSNSAFTVRDTSAPKNSLLEFEEKHCYKRELGGFYRGDLRNKRIHGIKAVLD